MRKVWSPSSTTTLPLLITIGDVSVTEGDTGAISAVLPVSLVLRFPRGCEQSTTRRPQDPPRREATIIASSGTLRFPAGQTSRSISVPVFGDRINEATETLSVTLSNPVNATLARALGVVTIVDNDAAGLAISDAVVTEPASGTANAIFAVTLSPASSETVTVGYATADGTATAPTDYTAATPGATLTFLAWTDEPDDSRPRQRRLRAPGPT